jgi:PilZ domain
MPTPPAAQHEAALGATEAFQEKREFTRFPFRGRAKAIVFPASGRPESTELLDSEVITSDLSRGGVSILYRQALVRGQQLLLVLNDTNQMVEVRWCCRVWDGLFAAGCRFIGSPGTPSAEQLLDAVDAVIGDECLWWDGDSEPAAQ